MAIKDVSSKCWILALFVRDDNERFLLGDGSYEFVEKQLHFVANNIANDVVEVQGNDGYLLAGQVRRPAAQSFDGYVGDSSTSKATVEERRRAFFAFFRKNHFYKVIYVFPDGSAIQRKRGFLVDAPEVKELWQIYPQYHVALNFEDINYYYYDENADGDEIYGKSATISLNSAAQTGGLIWVDPGTTTITEEGTDFTVEGTLAGGTLSSLQLKGDTDQQTYSGKNLLNTYDFVGNVSPNASGTTLTVSTDGTITFSNNPNPNGWCGINGNSTTLRQLAPSLIAGNTYYLYLQGSNLARTNIYFDGSSTAWGAGTAHTITQAELDGFIVIYGGYNVTTTAKIMITSTSDNSFEPYVGGTASPNPDYPQEVQTATGRQVVTISDGGSQSQSYEVNLGKNLFDKDNINIFNAYFDTSGGSITSSNYNRVFYVPCEPNTTYSFTQGTTSASNHLFQVATTSVLPAVGVTVSNFVDAGNSGPVNYSTGADAKYLVVRIRPADDVSTLLDGVQIEKGSTATTYAPYFTPIELCKIGDYQAYIYQRGSDWYLHKEIRGVDIATFSWGDWVRNMCRTADITDIKYVSSNTQLGTGLATNYIMSIGSGMSGDDRFGRIAIDVNRVAVNTGSTSVTPTGLFYYALATPTDTQITNEALVSQLNAVAGAMTYAGQTMFTVNGNGNLAAILSVELQITGGGGVLWEDDGAVWEEGKPSYSMITIDSIDNVYPVVTITGRTVNPILTDVTTGTIFKYEGTITASQVLVVDMMNKTATLNGTSVIGNVTGDWLYLAPGNNRMTYTADNADAPNATIEWQEIVG